MELFIRIIDGQPFEHPIFGDNFRQAFPDVDTDNLPPEFARFERVDPVQKPGELEVMEVSYQWVGGVVKDVWTVRQMTDDERSQKLQELTDAANAAVAATKTMVQEHIEAATNDATKRVWTDYLNELDAWVLTDPLAPNIPRLPRFDASGNVITTAAAGSAPNVIG